MTVSEKLINIQVNLKAPKSQYNSFGKYKYRSCEDILEAVKPLLKENKLTLIISDSVEMVGNRFYIKSTATITDIETGEVIETSAYAREDETKKGMDLSQVTGSTSSYARKYALNGLLCIDDTKDSDSTNTQSKNDKPATTDNEKISESQVKRLFALAGKDKVQVVKEIMQKHKYSNSKDIKKSDYETICTEIESEIKKGSN